MNTQRRSVNLVPGMSAPAVLHASEGDVGRVLEIVIIDDQLVYNIPSTATVTITATKPSGMGFTQACTVTENGTATFETTASMTDESGKMQAEVRIVDGGKNIGTANLLWIVERNPHPSNVIDGDVERAKTILERADEAMAKAEQMIEEVEIYNSIVEEVEDIRVGVNGTVYDSAGDAVRGQVSALKEDLNLVNDGYYAFDLIPNKYILRDNGQESNYNGWSATDYIMVPPHSLIRIDTNGALLPWGAKYDSAKQYVEAAAWSQQLSEMYNDSDSIVYYRTSGSNKDIANIKITVFPQVDKTLTKSGIPADAKTVGDKFANIDSQIDNVVVPSYYRTSLDTKEATIRGHEQDCSYNGDALVFITDTHYTPDYFMSDNPSTIYNANNSLSLVKDVVKNTATPMIVFGGDLVNTASDIDTMIHCINLYVSKYTADKDRVVYCCGNHEYYTGADLGTISKPTPNWLYGAGQKYNEYRVLGKTDTATFYFDNELQKIRYFVVSCGRDTEITIAQVEWILNEFLKIPNGYRVVLIGHAFVSDRMNAIRGRHQGIADGFDKVKAGASFSYNNVTYDYSALVNVEPICIITGHTHIDGSLMTTGGIPIICTTCDSYAQNYELVDGTPTKSPRTKGTVDEQAFDVFQFDFTNRKIYCTRIGYGSDREFNY